MASGSTRSAQAGNDVMFATIIIFNLTNVFEIAITLFGIWHNKMFDFNSHQWCVNLALGARQPAAHMVQVDARGKVSHNINTTTLVICFNAYVCK